ncbi:voltage-gated potassium channel [Allocatelliglobosispora scoriae]|uniref:Voltage-gated potassium channel n=1 Tax=Allocatelliglobosispora scoriae TaxID=643052 RepID=A0A841BME2_9ACTN|nr:ion channel [Allocatelliglobosispora scoriae]MBB5868835.1 voltage-gated potassium channel [Allocatelliglobosispora scoriae]
MFSLLYRLVRGVRRKSTWALPATVIVFVFATSWPLMALAEPVGSKILEPANYWWWFVITATTVGYGDFFPVSPGGHVVGAYVIVGGIATFATLFTRISIALENVKGRRMHGTVELTTADHVVVLGYTPGRTERIVDELLADGSRPIALGAWSTVESHPMAERDIDFVRGDLTDEGVLRRASVHRAHSVLIDARDDNEALAVLVTVDHLTTGAHIVVALRDMDRAAHLSYVNAGVRCVQWHQPHLLTEELQDPGIAQVYTDLMTHGGGNTYSMKLPASLDGISFGECQAHLGQHHDTTVLAVNTGESLLISPSWQEQLRTDMVIYYVGQARLDPAAVARGLRPAKSG